MQQTIDVTGLPEPVIRDLERMVEELREFPMNTDCDNNEWKSKRDDWLSFWRNWCEKNARPTTIRDDSRENIYEGRGE